VGPAGSAAAILTLGLTIGVGTAIFAVVDRILLTPPPYRDPDALVTLGEVTRDAPTTAPRPVTAGTFAEWRRTQGSLFSALEAFDPTNLTLSGLGLPERISATIATTDFFTMLGVTPVLGRTFTERDRGVPVAIITDDFWRSHFSAAPDALGRPIVLNGQSYEIIGILPPAFTFGLNPSDVWLPMPAVADTVRVRVVGRLAASTTSGSTAVALNSAGANAPPAIRFVVTPLRSALTGSAAVALPAVLAAACLAVVLAMMNLAGLLLARLLDRQREFAVRAALGARKRDLLGEVLAEAHVLVASGAALGILLASALTPVAGRLVAEQLGRTEGAALAISWRAIVALIVSSLVCAWGAGAIPGIRATRQRLGSLGRALGDRHRDGYGRRLLVAGELALACVLVASLLAVGQSLRRLSAIDPGFVAKGIVAMGVSPSAVDYPDAPSLRLFYQRLDEALRLRLGPGTAAFIDELPLTHDRGRATVRPEGLDRPEEAVTRTASAGYFAILGIPVVAGREFDHSDTLTAPGRVIVSKSLVARLYPDSAAVGRTLRVDGRSTPVEIVGVVSDVKLRSLDDPDVSTMYFAMSQTPSRSSAIVLRADRGTAGVVATVRETAAGLDPLLPIARGSLLSETVARSPGVPLRGLLQISFAAFSVLALVVAGLGVFGSMSYDVTRRRHELALRLAVGATPLALLRRVLASALALAAVGVGIGGVLLLPAMQALQSALVDVAPGEPAILAAVAAIMVIVSAAAALPPARRAARTDPMSVLRGE
jgi:predicted permease